MPAAFLPVIPVDAKKEEEEEKLEANEKSSNVVAILSIPSLFCTFHSLFSSLPISLPRLTVRSLCEETLQEGRIGKRERKKGMKERMRKGIRKE